MISKVLFVSLRNDQEYCDNAVNRKLLKVITVSRMSTGELTPVPIWACMFISVTISCALRIVLIVIMIIGKRKFPNSTLSCSMYNILRYTYNIMHSTIIMIAFGSALVVNVHDNNHYCAFETI